MSRQTLIQACHDLRRDRKTFKNNADGFRRLNDKLNRTVEKITEEIFNPLNQLFEEAGWGYEIDCANFAANGDMPRIRRRNGWRMGDGPTVAATVVDALRADNADLVRRNDDLEAKVDNLKDRGDQKSKKIADLTKKLAELYLVVEAAQAEEAALPASEDEEPDLEDGVSDLDDEPETTELPAAGN